MSAPTEDFSGYVADFRHALEQELAPETNDSLELNFMMFRDGDTITILGGYGGEKPNRFEMSIVRVSPVESALRLARIVKTGFRHKPASIRSMFRDSSPMISQDGVRGENGPGPCPAGISGTDDH